MQLGKVKDLFKDWVKSGFYFGRGLSDHISARLNASPQTARVGGGLFDLAAGAGLTYLAATSAIGTVVGVALAVSAIATAPLTAVTTTAMGVVWLALSTITGGIGLGLLDAAREKAGIARPSASSSYVAPRTRGMFGQMKSAAKSALKFDRKAKQDFRDAVEVKPAPAPGAAPERKPAPKANGDYKL